MTATELLAELRQRNIRLWVEDGRLRFDAPKGALTDALRAEVTAQRTQLLELLAGRSAREAQPLGPAPRTETLPLSFGQQRLWFLDQLSPDDLTYNVPATVRLQGVLHADALGRAIQEVVRRHDTLRARFPSVDGRAQLVIEPFSPRPLHAEVLEHLPAAERLAEATRLAREDATRSFDLAAGPLFRVRLFRMSADDHVLHVVMHHIISDGWSMGVFFRELAALYGAFLKGEPSPLPELPLQYADYAHWQQESLEGRGLANDLAWWRQRLGGELPTLDLPTDRPRHSRPTHRGAFEWFPLDPELRSALNRLAQREGATNFQVMLSAFFVLLARHCGQDDLVIGTPIAARSRREIEGLIGFFVNNLVLRGDLSGDPTFRDLLKRVRTMVLDTFARQDTPFEKLVEELSPERELGRNPLFQVLFNHFDGSDYSFALPPLQMSTLDMTLAVSKFDLTLHCFETEGRLHAKFEYDSDLFNAETVRGFGERYLTLLRGIVADPGCVLSRLPMLDDAERRQLLVEWNRTDGELPAGNSVHALFEAQVAKTPEAPALVFEHERLTFAELDRRATALARRLVAQGVGPEVRVALFLDRSAELVVALLGVLKAGGAYVPIDVSAPPERVSFVLADSDCRLLLTRAKFVPQLPAGDVAVLCLDAADAADGDARVALPAARPGQLAYVIYTSGSTGQPKGVEVEHAQLLDYLAGIVPRLDVPADSSYASVSTLAADLGNTSLFPALCGGGCLHLLSDERIGDGDAFGNYMHEHAVDVLKIVPSHLEALLAAAARPADVLPRRLLVLGGEACSWELVEHVQSLAPHCAVMNHYGPAETTVGKLVHRLEPGDRQRFPKGPPLGRPLANARIYLVDSHREPVPVGAVGELLIGGRGVTRGYRNQPALTAARFIADPFRRGTEGRVYCTGDLARYTRDGQLLFVGRNDDQVKLRGFRVELGEVRACLERHAEVAASAVLVQKDPLGSKRLVAYVVPKAGRQPDPADLRAFARLALPDYMVPASIVLLDALPLNSNGKLDRRALPAADFDREALQGDYVPPRTPAEEILARIWCDVLRLERVGVNDNFFELGGESILSIQIISRANQAGLHLKPRDVFERATIAGLAAAAGTVDKHRAEQGPVTGPVPLTPVQHRFFAHEVAQPWHYNHAMLLSVQRPLDPALLGRALLALEQHHDVLRLRFTRSAGGWAQVLAPPTESAPHADLASHADHAPHAGRAPRAGHEQAACSGLLEVHDLSALPASACSAAIGSLAEAAQAGLDLQRGPLWRALFIRLAPGQRDRLLLVVHHLAVDGVSWRLLLEDLGQALGQLETGRAVELPPKTSSFKLWAERLVERAADESTLREAGFWLTDEHRRAAPLPVDHEPGPDTNLARDADTLQVALDEAETTLLLREVPKAFHTQINDVLLTALVRACAPWTGSQRLLLDLEGHGREDLFEDVDTSRTVGWFTSVHPVVLDAGASGDPGDALCAVKEQLRAIPGRGLGWGLLRWLSPASDAVTALRALPAAQVGFNYMGHFEQSLHEGALFGRAPESPGAGTSLANRRRYLLDVGGSISGGRLHVSWTWATRVHDRPTIEALAARFLQALRELIRHCTTPGVGRHTPSDFPLARLNAAELSLLQARYGKAGIEDITLMSPLQRGMVFHSIAEPESSAYVTQLALTLHGELSPPAFQAAWQAALDANPILRTALVVPGLREMHQVVCRKLELRWTSDDWSALPADELRARLAAQAHADRAQGFDLADAPLMRLRLIRIGEDQHRFLWTHHHALLDGWSLPLLIRDVFTAYQSRGGQALPPRRPFSEYIRWVQGQDTARAETHWRALLSDWSEATPLPAECAPVSAANSVEREAPSADAARPATATSAAAAPRAILGEELSQAATAALAALARRQHITLNTLVQGAWALLLSRHSGQQDVLFGVTVSGRPPDLPGVETMLGLFINTLPLRVDCSDAPLLPWLVGVQSQLMELQQLQASPLYEVQRLAAGRGSGPLFESLVVFENYPVAVSEPVRTSGLRIEDAVDVSHATYPLALVVAPRQRLHLELRYDTRRYTAGTIHRLLQQLGTLLAAMAARPESTLRQLPMLSEDERARQLKEWNATESAYPRDATVPDLFEAQARATPEAQALDFGGEQLTYAQLDLRANRLAARLALHGVRSGDLVAIRVERGVELVVGLLGILKAGAAYLPLDTEDPAPRVAFMLQDSGARLLLTREALADAVPDFTGKVLLLANDGEGDGDDRADADAAGGAALSAAPGKGGVAAAPQRTGAATDRAYLIYTSGSTGIPKGASIPHRGITRLVLGADYVQLRADDRVAQMSNASFDAATFEIWGALLNGACVVGIDKHVALSPQRLAQTLREQRLSVLFVTTALFNQLVRHVPDIFATLRALLFGGEAVSPRWVQQVLQRGPPQRLLHVYGPTECTTYSTWHLVTHVPDDAVTVPIGQPIAHSTAYVLDGHRQLVPVGAPGELYLGGDGLALGYHERPELNAERFVPHPFSSESGARLYRTGDLVRRRPDGAIEFVGRIDQQVKLRGFRIELGEVEAALRRQPGVKEVIVLCREDEPGDKQLVAYIVAALDAAPQRDALRAALAAELPDFMIPSAFVALAAMPLNANGKVDRRALPAPGGRQSSRVFAAPHTETEQRVAGIWRDVLGVERVGRRDNFFDLGGHSLKLLSVHARLVAELGATLTVTDLFQHTTVEALALRIDDGRRPGQPSAGARELRREADARAARRPSAGDGAIAIIGMAGRFPGAPDVDAFWRNLCGGVESVTFFSDAELAAAGVPPEYIAHPKYVKARAILQDPDRFDAHFFGYTPRDAELMDPQQRLFLECAWEACERAGCDPERYAGLIGVFAGASMNSYLENLRTAPDVLAAAGGIAAIVSSLGDFLATRVSYKLDLRGPSVTVQTACSTSLVAVHEACASLLAGRCDMALAGGVSVTVPWTSGYLYEESGIRSSDGHCRTFDARAQGMVSGNGVALVVLKRLADALADGDTIHAVIRGSATNNDGARKVGFTAPSIEGQAEVIAQAQAAAGVAPESIGYVECHGTATALGDPIEVAALTRVFREGTAATGFCALASLKSNMGHLDAAAGVAGLIKAALAVEHGRIPPSLHYTSPNPEIDFASSPFFVNTECREWIGAPGAPRRAGVSAFGIGGTNAHVVLEEPPHLPESGASREWQLLQLSARTPAALDAMTQRLAAHLQAHSGICLADVAHTLRNGRRQFEHRRAVLCRDVSDAVPCLQGAHPERRWTQRAKDRMRPVVFLFPGQGAQYVDMGRELHRHEPHFRKALDECFAILREAHGLDLRAALFPEGSDRDGAAERLTRTSFAQPALFAIEYALAQQWLAWGVRPAASIGHSVGEFVSACLAGVMSLADALRLVTIRGRLMEQMPAGVMLAVPLPEAELQARLAARPGLWLTGVNAPSMCVVGGAELAVAAFEQELAAAGTEATRLHTSHAFHSGLMDAAVAPFVEEARKVALSAPREPYVSTLTGDWITAEQATDPEFWGRQIREPVRYSEAIARLLEDDTRVLLEVGPGTTLGSLARAQPLCGADRLIVASLRHARASDADNAFLLGALGRLWVGGVDHDGARFAAGEQRRRIGLPTYPFERQRYWIERRAAPAPTSRRALDDWFYAPTWRLTPRPERAPPEPGARCLVFGDGDERERAVLAGLSQAGAQVIVVRPDAGGADGARGGTDGVRGARGGTDDAASLPRVRQLVTELLGTGGMPEHIVHLWGCRDGDDPEAQTERGFLHLMHLARALGEAEVTTPVRIAVVTAGVHTVTGREVIRPEQALVLGLCRVLPLEQPNVSCRNIDLDGDEPLSMSAGQLVDELLRPADDTVVAWRGGRRFVESFAPVPLAASGNEEPAVLREGGTYLVTGGLGGMGLALARQLHTAVGARLVLLGRTPLPPREHWPAYLAAHAPRQGSAQHDAPHTAAEAAPENAPSQRPKPAQDDAVLRRIRGVLALEASGAEVLVLAGDVCDRAAMADVVAAARARFGAIHGVIHAAGIPPGGILLRKDAASAQAVLAPKVAGTRVLMELLGDSLDVIVLCSSLNAVKGFPGAADYAAANAFLDAFARSLDSPAGPRVVSIAWNRWRESGMAVDAAGGALAADQGIADAEGMEVLQRVLAGNPGPHVLISERELRDVLATARPGADTAEAVTAEASAAAGTVETHTRPSLATEFVAASSELERQIAAVWEQLFGIRPIGVHDDFFELGGHSLLAMRVVNSLSQQFGTIKLTLRALFDAPTISGLAVRIAAALAAAEARPTPRTDAAGTGAGTGTGARASVPAGAGASTALPALETLDADALAALSDDEVTALLRQLSDEARDSGDAGEAGGKRVPGESRP